jgi:hypothetical protein
MPFATVQAMPHDITPYSVPTWPFMAAAQPPAAVDQPNNVASPDAWVDLCAACLAELVQDEGVGASDLRAVAAAMAEEPAYRALSPEAAAQLHARREA